MPLVITPTGYRIFLRRLGYAEHDIEPIVQAYIKKTTPVHLPIIGNWLAKKRWLLDES